MKFFVQVWIDRDKVRARFKRYRRRIAELEDALDLESQSVNYYRDKWNEARQTTLRVRRQADDNREEADRARYAVQDELDKKKKELDRCRRTF